MTDRPDPLRATPGAAQLHVLLDYEPPGGGSGCNIDETFVQHWCLAALQAQNQLMFGDGCDIEVSVQLLPASSIRVINRQYRGQDKATNVLSFSAELPRLELSEALPDAGFPVSSLMPLGDLVLCPEIISSEAFEQNKSLLHHWAHMLVHGMLHLCGYDHEDAEQAKIMESMEIQILSTSGISNPYRALAP